MNTGLSTTLGFIPLTAFWTLAGFGHDGVAAAAGLGTSLALNAFRLSRGDLKRIELAALGFLVAFNAALLAGISVIIENGSQLAFVVLGITAAITVLQRKPWSADYSRADWPEALHQTRRFIAVNMVMSGIWAAIFLFIPLANVLAVPSLLTTVIVFTAGIASFFAPNLLVRYRLHREIAAAEPHKWSLPTFEGPREGERFHVAVIGAGMGGLTSAALLARSGLRVIVAEQHVLAGGFCHSWLRKARHKGKQVLFRFDSGVHDISGCHPGGSIRGILDRLGAGDRINWLRMTHESTLGDKRVAIPEDWREYVALLCDHYPTEAEEIRALFDTVHAIYDAMYSTGEGLSGVPGKQLGVDEKLAFPRTHPEFIRWEEKSFLALLDHFLKSPKLKENLLHLAGYLTDNLASLSVLEMVPIFGYYFHGGHYPEGGSSRLAETLCNVICENGGKVLLGSPVEQIVMENGRAAGLIVKNGKQIGADIVISNADPAQTFGKLIAPEDREALPKLASLGAARPENASTSAFCVYLGLDRQVVSTPIIHAKKDGLEMGIVSPSLVDPSAAPEGMATLEIMTLIAHDEAESWFAGNAADNLAKVRRSKSYQKRKAELGERLIGAAESVIPGLRERIVFRCDSSPLTYHRYALTASGAIYGVNKRARLGGLKTLVPNLIYVGASGKFGSGVEAVMISGAHAAEMLRPGILAS